MKISDLVLDPSNARKHAVKNLEAIKGSLAKFGMQKPIVVGKGNVVIAGNGTLEAARALGWDKIDVVRTTLEGPDAIAFAIADNRTGELAEWDAGVLSETLKSLQAMDFDLGAIGFDADDLAKMATVGVEDSLYTSKITAPIYEIKGDKPSVASLVDRKKAEALLCAIEKADLPKDVKDFLEAAACRHLVFSYEKIAEYYAHAAPPLQDLMERSALVIIDFAKAVEGGFVVLSENLAEAYKGDD